MLIIDTAEIRIDSSECELTYARSSGPGGQNVNKVNSKAVLRWNLYKSNGISPVTRAKLMGRLKTQLTLDGDIILTSDRFRDQIRNREDCFEKFKDLMLAAVARPKIRKETKPSYSSQRRVKEQKSRQSDKKSSRKYSRDHD